MASDFEVGFALGDEGGPEYFLQGAGLDDALREAEKLYARHTEVWFDGDAEQASIEEHTYLPNLRDVPAKSLPMLAKESSSLRTFSEREVMSMTEREAWERLHPFFHRKALGEFARQLEAAGKSVFNMGYETPGKMKTAFLTENAKLMKGAKGLPGVPPGYSRGAALLPHRKLIDKSRKQLPEMGALGFCVGSTKGCREVCLVGSGRNPMADSQYATKLARSESLVMEPAAWLRMFVAAVEWHIQWCKARSLVSYVRPNVLSDIPWELVAPWLFKMFPKLSIYDYTKVPNRVVPSNYDLTFSFTVEHVKWAQSELRNGRRLAVVFWLAKGCSGPYRSRLVNLGVPKSEWKCDTPDRIRGLTVRGETKDVQVTLFDQPVIDGDSHDFRSLDPSPSIVGLSFKPPVRKEGGRRRRLGKAEKFVLRVQRDKTTGMLLVDPSPAQLGAETIFEEQSPALLETV